MLDHVKEAELRFFQPGKEREEERRGNGERVGKGGRGDEREKGERVNDPYA